MVMHGKDFLSKKCENHSMQTKRNQNLLQICKAEHGNLVGSGDSAVQSSGSNPSSFHNRSIYGKNKKKTIYRTGRIIKEASKRELQCLIRKRAKKNK